MTAPVPRVRMPAAPMLERIDAAGGLAPICNRVGIRGETERKKWEQRIERARALGEVTVRVADLFAIELVGIHPALIWPEWFTAGYGSESLELLAESA